AHAAFFSSYLKKLATVKNSDGQDFDQLLFHANAYRILSGRLSPRGLEVVFKSWSSRFQANMTPKSLRQAAIFKWLALGESHASIKEWLGVAPAYSLAPFVEEAQREAELKGYFPLT